MQSDVREAESSYLRALIDDYKSPVAEGKSRTSMVEALILSRSKSRLKKILATSPLGQLALKSQE